MPRDEYDPEMKISVGVVAVMLLGACGQSEQATPPATKAAVAPAATVKPREALLACLKGVGTAGAVGPSRRIAIVAGACAAQPGFATYGRQDASAKVQHLLDHSDLACTPAAKKAAASAGPDAYKVLVAECGAAYYGLPAGREGLFSEQWYVLQRVAAWLGAADGSAEHAAILTAARDLRIELPLPSTLPGVSALPEVPNVDNEVPGLIVFVGAKPTVATRPVLRLSKEGVIIDEGPFGPMPGTALPLDEAKLVGLDATSAVLVADRVAPARQLLQAVRAVGRPAYLVAASEGGSRGVIPVPIVVGSTKPGALALRDEGTVQDLATALSEAPVRTATIAR